MWPFRKRQKASQSEQLDSRLQQTLHQYDKQFKLVPPEGVPLYFPLASIGERLGAQIADYCVTFFTAVFFIYILSQALNNFDNAIFTILWLVFFLIRIPYYIITELVWNGKTLAKRWMGLRVISTTGQSLTPHQIVSRNIMREIEFFVPLSFLFSSPAQSPITFTAAIIWIIIIYVILRRSKNRQRIGDIIAMTTVIKDHKSGLFKDVAQNKTQISKTHSFNTSSQPDTENSFIFNSHHMDHYGTLELVTLENLLRTYETTPIKHQETQKELLQNVTNSIVKKINYPEKIQPNEHYSFLKNFYQAQRTHLENRKLFGDIREHKLYREKDKSLNKKDR